MKILIRGVWFFHRIGTTKHFFNYKAFSPEAERLLIYCKKTRFNYLEKGVILHYWIQILKRFYAQYLFRRIRMQWNLIFKICLMMQSHFSIIFFWGSLFVSIMPFFLKKNMNETLYDKRSHILIMPLIIILIKT